MGVVPATQELTEGRRVRDWLGDRIMFGLTLVAALATVAIMVAVAYKVVRGADLSFQAFGLSFVSDSVWDTNKEVYGAAQFLFGTAVTSLIALLIATPLAIAIALFLSELAPRGVRGTVGALVELLAAIPSVVLGLWGILVLGPFVANHIEPSLDRLPAHLQRQARLERDLRRLARARDHGRPDRRQHLPRAIPERAERAGGGRAGARLDSLGDGAGRRALLVEGRDRGGGDPRPRAGDRRGDRGDAGDRGRQQRHPRIRVRDR